MAKCHESDHCSNLTSQSLEAMGVMGLTLRSISSPMLYNGYLKTPDHESILRAYGLTLHSVEDMEVSESQGSFLRASL